MPAPLAKALAKAGATERLNRDEALAVARAASPDDVHRLGQAALANRRARFGDRATYVCNLQINPSNLCEGQCQFCRYGAKPGDAHAYELSEHDILSRIAELQPTEVHVVGGMNRVWGFERSLALVQEIRRRHPDIFIKAFTAVEIDWFARTSNKDESDVLTQLRDAGLNALTGGGAEVFSPRWRQQHCPDKLPGKAWLRIHQTAHALGIVTNATMLYGLDDSPEERVDHLLALRDAQDESRGFSCFIPLAYQGGANGAPARPSPKLSLAIIALARLVLDNFPHVKAYWPMIGLDCAAAGLSWGADDLDGTLGRERIAHAAGAATPEALARREMEETIRLAGFTPVERLGNFEVRART